MRVHLIAVGGAVMYNLAVALQQNGHDVSGSDEVFSGPARSHLAAAGLLPLAGWHPEKISSSIETVVIGPQTGRDNPELLRAQALGLLILSYPEFVHALSLQKTRIVVAGTHGKSTVLAMAMHCLKRQKIDFDYVLGETVEGHDSSVRLTGASFILLEGHASPCSMLDATPIMAKYRPNAVVVTGINQPAQPTIGDYHAQFVQLISMLEPGANLIWHNQDQALRQLIETHKTDAQFFSVPYDGFPAIVQRGTQIIKMWGKPRVPMSAFGDHNLANAKAASLVCRELGVWMEDFLRDLASFKSLPQRLELLAEARTCSAWADRADTPDSISTTVAAVKNLHPNRELLVCLHLQATNTVLPQFSHALDEATHALVLVGQGADVSPKDILKTFQHVDLQVFNSMNELEKHLEDIHWLSRNLLFLGSDPLGSADLGQLAKRLFA